MQHYDRGFSFSEKLVHNDQNAFVHRTENDFRHIPFGLGFEGGLGGTFGTEGQVFPSVLFFMDVNLSKRVVFFKGEYGMAYFLKDEKLYNYASIGLNYKVTEDRKHNFYLHGGAFGMWVKSGGEGGGAGLFLGFRYRYSIADQVGLVTSLRYPMGSFKSIMITAGLNFFAF
jgi:hypothetical protein